MRTPESYLGDVVVTLPSKSQDDDAGMSFMGQAICNYFLAQDALQSKVSRGQARLSPNQGATGSPMVPPSQCFSLTCLLLSTSKVVLSVYSMSCAQGGSRCAEPKSWKGKEIKRRAAGGTPGPFPFRSPHDEPFRLCLEAQWRVQSVTYIMLQTHSPVFSRKLWSGVY